MSTANPPAPAKNLHGHRRDAVVTQLLADIFHGHYRAGERLIIQEVAKRLQMSPTPIREALVQLASIGVIEFVPNCGGVVRAMTSRDVEEICQVRKALECEAVRSACGRIDLVKLRELATAFRKIANAKRHGASFIENARKLDSELHDMIAESCGNRFLAGELERLKLLFRAFRDASWDERMAGSDYDRVAEEAAEHLAIADAMLAGNPREASRAMSRHIRTSVRYWTRGLPQ